jgi:hypothetical protein
MFEINKGVLGPEALLKLFAGDYLSMLFKQDRKDLERAILDFEADAGFAELTGAEIGFKRAEADDGRKLGRRGQKGLPQV